MSSRSWRILLGRAALLLVLALSTSGAGAVQAQALNAVVGPALQGETFQQGPCVPRPRVGVRTEKVGEKDFRVTITAGQGNVELIRFGNSPNARIDLPGQKPGVTPPFDYKPVAVSTYSFIVHAAGVGTAVTVPLTIYDGCGQNYPWNSFIGAGQSATQSQVSVADASATESDAGSTNLTFTVSLSAPASVPVSVQYTTANGTATAAADYTASNGSVSFAVGETSKTITVPILGDTLDEPNETFTVTLSGASGATIGAGTATGTIVDNEGSPSLSVNDVTLAEGNSSTTAFGFTITLSSPSGQPVTVQYATANDTATTPADYAAIAATTVTFAPGETTRPVTVQVAGEDVFETNERFFVNLTNPTNATVSKAQGTGTITNDDPIPTVTLGVSPGTFGENASTTLTATLSNRSSLPVTVALNLGGSATAPPGPNHDYTLSAPQIEVTAGSTTGSVTISAVDDTVSEGNEIVEFSINTVTNGTAGSPSQVSATISENESVPTVSLSVTGSPFSEELGTATVIATLSGQVDEPVTVTLTVGGGSASSGDFLASGTSILIPAFQTSGNITLTGVHDDTPEGDELVPVTIATVVGGGVTAGSPSTINATIADDDAPSVTLALEDLPLEEAGGAATVRATLSQNAILATTITLGFSGTATIGAGNDYTASSTTINIGVGQQTGTITLTGLQDTTFDPAETVIVDITGSTNAVELTPQQVTATIDDDDSRPTVSLSLTNSPFSENLGTATVTATLSNLSNEDVTVNVAFSGTADVGVDYSPSTTPIVIAHGTLSNTLTLTGSQDLASEGDETVIVDISSVTNGTEDGAQQVTATITDDDLPNVTLSLTGSPLAENGGVATVTATLSNTWTQNVTVDLDFAGSTATLTDDYTRTGAQIVILANNPSNFITLTGVSDAIFEGPETVVVSISGVTNGTENGTQQVTATITDQDSVPTITLSDDDADNIISENGGSVTLTATLSHATTQTVTINLAYTGTATNVTDYTRNSLGLQLTIAPLGLTATQTITAVDDTTFEGDKTVIVDIDTVSNATESVPQTVSITIDEDDPSPTAFLTVVPSSPSNISETGGLANITANLTSSVASATTITLAITGTATITDDYTRTVSLDLVIPAGALVSSTTFDITAVGDLLDEPDETVIVDIATVTGGIAEGTPNQITVTITDDDPTPTIAWTSTDPTVTESAGTVTSTAQLSAASGRTITVQVAVAGTATGGAGQDFTTTPALPSPLTLTFNPGVTSQDVSVIINDDTISDGADETVILTLQTPSNVDLGTPTVRTITIQDNDPDAVADSYAATGNIQLTVPVGTLPCGQTTGVLCNDLRPVGTALVSFGPLTGLETTAGNLGSTAQGGDLSLAADGSFVYNPPPGFTGADTFVYRLVNGGSSDTATVTITVSGDANGDLVWFVNENASTAGDGRLTTPFDSLAGFNTANQGGTNQPKAGDFVFLYESAADYVGNVTLLGTQKLIGQDASATIQSIYAVTLATGSATLPAANPTGTTVRVTNTTASANAITLGSGNTLRGLTIGNVTSTGTGIAGTSFGTLTVSEALVNTDGRVLNLDTGALSGGFTSVTSTGGANNVKLETVTGTFALGTGAMSGATGASFVLGDGSGAASTGGTVALTYSGTITASGGRAVEIQDRPASAGAITLSGAITGINGQTAIFMDDNASGTVTFSGTVTAPSTTATAISLTDNTNTTVSFTAGNLDIDTSSGTGFLATGGGTVNVSGSNNTIVATSGPALNLNGITAAIALTSTSSASSGSNGISLNTVSGTVSLGTTSVTSSAATSVSLASNSAAITFGDLDISPDANARALHATNNTGAITTTSGSITGVSNAVAVEITRASGTTPLNVTLTAVNASGGANGIVLTNTSTTSSPGGFRVVGGAGVNDGSGGTIQNSTSHGVSLTGAAGVSFNNLNVQNTSGSGIKGTDVSTFSLTNSTVNNSGTGGGNQESNLAFNTQAAGTENNLDGTVTITGNTLTTSRWHGISIVNFAGTIADATISNNTITSSTSAASSLGSGIQLVAFGSAATTANVTKATLDTNTITNFPSGAGIAAQAGNGNAAGTGVTFGTPGNATNIIAITNNTIAGASSANKMGTNGILAAISGTNGSSRGQANFNISNNGTVGNALRNIAGNGISVNTFGYATSTWTVSTNVIQPNHAANSTASSGIAGGTGCAICPYSGETPEMTVTVNANVITETDGPGILLVTNDSNHLGSVGFLRATITNNNVAAPKTPASTQGIVIRSGSSSSDSNVCLDIRTNTSHASLGDQGTSIFYGIGLRKEDNVATVNIFGIDGISPAAPTNPQVVTFVDGNNPAGGDNGQRTLIVSGSNFVTCSSAP